MKIISDIMNTMRTSQRYNNDGYNYDLDVHNLDEMQSPSPRFQRIVLRSDSERYQSPEPRNFERPQKSEP